MNEKKVNDGRGARAGKECAYLALFTAILIAAQFCFFFLLGVEIVTVLFVSYAFVFGAKRGMLVAVAFSTLRLFLFGFFPNVLFLYLVYFNLVALLFGGLGKMIKKPLRSLWLLTAIACLCTLFFSLLDGVITPLWYGMRGEAWRVYFLAALPVALPQVLCTAITVVVLFLPLARAFYSIKKRL